MTLKSRTVALLEGGANSERILDVVREFKDRGTSQRDVYDQLHELWTERGYADADDPNPVRDELEYVMEIVWGFCPAGLMIWETTLSEQSQPS